MTDHLYPLRRQKNCSIALKSRLRISSVANFDTDTPNQEGSKNDSANSVTRVDRYRDLDSIELWVQRHDKHLYTYQLTHENIATRIFWELILDKNSALQCFLVLACDYISAYDGVALRVRWNQGPGTDQLCLDR